MLPVHLREPSNEPARRRTAATLARREGPAALDGAALRRDRDAAARAGGTLAERLAAALAAHGVRVTVASTAAEAADRIAVVAAGRAVAVTRAAILGELHDALVARHLELVTTYGPGQAPFTGRHRRFWQVPSHATNWQTAPAPEDAGERRDVVGLFGVNAAAAESGAVYVVQHSTNIGDLLRTAARRVFVIGVDKIAIDEAAARRQVDAVTAAGTDTVLLDLSRTTPVGDPLARFPVVPGPAETEVILLDNGRRALAGGPYATLLTCIGCRGCATRCPTYPLFRGPRGWSPKDYLWSHLRGENPSLELCTFCGNCEVDCPVDIPLPDMIAERRAEAIAEHGRGLAGWRRRMEGQVEGIDRLFSATAPLSSVVQRLPLAGVVMERVFGLTAQRPLPEFQRDTFERRQGRRGEARARGGRRIVYYPGCFANWNDPDVGDATVEILERLGYEVVLPAWRCCGIPLYAKGEIRAAAKLAAANVASLAAHVEAGDEVVTSCPSCQLALARDYPRFFPSAAAERVAAHTHFLSRFLLERHDGLAGQVGAGESVRAAYHLPCHLRALGMERDSVELLGNIPGVVAQSLDRGCCGMSGTFGIERAHYVQSMEVGQGVFSAVAEGGFDLVLTDCGSCKLQLEHGTGRRVTHPLQVVRRALAAAGAQGDARRASGGGR